MPLYYFHHGEVSGVSDCAFDLADDDAAWAEMTKVCGGLLGSISRNLKRNDAWEMELLDTAKHPVFKIRLVSEARRNRAGSIEPKGRS